jgi:hypothetical protein
MTLLKKNGEIEEFSVWKLKKSIYLSFLGGSRPSVFSKNRLSEIEKKTDTVCSLVMRNIFSAKWKTAPTTDDIRMAVEKELMSADYYAAKTYILYEYTIKNNYKKEGDTVGIPD